MKIVILVVFLIMQGLVVLSTSPSHRPTTAPVTHKPTNSPRPSVSPTVAPTAAPIVSPYPTPTPSGQPSSLPSTQPSCQPSMQPSRQPSRQPTGQPTARPSTYLKAPSSRPSRRPSTQPSSQPTASPSTTSTRAPTEHPTRSPTRKPTRAPTDAPTAKPTYTITSAPTPRPSRAPTVKPTAKPSVKPSFKPTVSPTAKPTQPTGQPSGSPSARPSSRPTTLYPTSIPTKSPHTSQPSRTHKPSSQPSGQPSRQPTGQPTSQPSSAPTLTHKPTPTPSGQPTSLPTGQPSRQPSGSPSSQPTSQPTSPSGQPTSQPTRQPSSQPTRQPTAQPSRQPTRQPTGQPTSSPSRPTPAPTPKPSPVSQYPTGQPSSQPTVRPSSQPSVRPTTIPTRSNAPSGQPTSIPTSQPSSQPTRLVYTNSPTGYYENSNVTGSVTYSPSDFQICEDLEITILINSWDTILYGDSIRISAPGITNGPCSSPTNGKDVFSSDLDLYNASEVKGLYREGNYSLNFIDSYFEFKVVNAIGFLYDTWYTVVIDRSNGMKMTNSLNATRWEVAISQCKDDNNNICSDWRNVGAIPVTNVANPRMGYAYSSSLKFTPAYQNLPVAMTLDFSLSFDLNSGDKLYIYLPGFSNRYKHFHANISDHILIGSTQNISSVYLTYNTSFSWTGRWFEGDYSDKYQGSYLLLQPRSVQYGLSSIPNRKFRIVVDAHPNTIAPQCGRPGNFIGFTYEFVSSASMIYSNRTRFDSVSAIGPSCTEFSKCNGHGSCDHCNSVCHCDDGYGSLADKARAISNDFAPDCSSMACPVGTAYGDPATIVTDGTHRLMECSGAGSCDRSSGKCICSPGKEGSACEHLTCPGKPKCSGRGICLSMRQLAKHSTALPLSTSTYDYFSFVSNQTVAWDDESNFGCVCDSSWPVGLGMNETQQSEYFGAACEFRHCPGGDDPFTAWVDESDCYGVAVSEGGETGAYGNKCHVDCSNRGNCDFSTGVCHCFPGYTGHNCASRTVY